MTETIRLRYSVFIFCIAFLSSCASTTLITVWKKESFHGTIGKIMVVGAFRTSSVRNFFEDEFVRQLRTRGISAVASYTVVPIDALSGKDIVIKQAREAGADAVLVTRYVGKKTVESYVPGEGFPFPQYYYHWGPYYDYIFQPGYMVTSEYAYAETNIYDAENETLIWAGRSRTLLSANEQSLIESFVSTVINRMASDKLI